jgi:hypothetical protein
MSIIFSNKRWGRIEKNFSFGKIEGIVMGEEGRGRKEVFVPSKYYILQGENLGLGVGQTKTGKPRINLDETSGTYLMIGTYRGYTRRGDGFIDFTRPEALEFLTVAYGADGGAGRIGRWYDYLIKINDFTKDTMIRLHYSGGGESSIILVTVNQIHIFDNIKSLQIWLDSGNTTTADLSSIDWKNRKFDYNKLTTYKEV